jgi:hypothetical protein
LRFEIVGRLRGTIAAESAVRVRNISRGGALIEAPWTLPQNSVQAVRLESEHHVSKLEARVRHVRESYVGGHYLIGLEFLAVDGPAAEQLDGVLLRHVPDNAQRT